jgi:hypothetical protein
VNTPPGQSTSEDTDRLLGGSVPFPQTFTPVDSAEAARDAGCGGEPAVGLPPYGSLLGEFLALMGRMEVDFTRRRDVAQLGDPMSAHRQDSHHGWPHHA